MLTFWGNILLLNNGFTYICKEYLQDKIWSLNWEELKYTLQMKTNGKSSGQGIRTVFSVLLLISNLLLKSLYYFPPEYNFFFFYQWKVSDTNYIKNIFSAVRSTHWDILELGFVCKIVLLISIPEKIQSVFSLHTKDEFSHCMGL